MKAVLRERICNSLLSWFRNRLLVAMILCGLLLFASSASAACSHYAGPTEQGRADGSSDANRFLVEAFWRIGGFGAAHRELCLAGGVYLGGWSMVFVPSGVTGTALFPVIIRGNGNTPLINGQGNRPVHLQGSHVYVQDVDATNGDNAVVKIHSSCSFCRVQRVVAWDASAVNGNAVFDVQGSNNLLEDVAAIGRARRTIIFDTSASGNTLRRAWARWEGNPCIGTCGNPTSTLNYGYGQNGIRFENVIATRNHTHGVSSEPEGIWTIFRTANSRADGVILYAEQGDKVDGAAFLDATNDAGSGAPIASTTNFQGGGLAVFVPPDTPEKLAMRFASNMKYPAGSGNTVNEAYAIGGAAPTCSSRSWSCQIAHVKSVAELPDKLWNLAGDKFCKKIVAGTVTAEPLWPWPMNRRIIAAMTRAGYKPIDVTATLVRIFGPIPSRCTLENLSSPHSLKIGQ